MLNLERSPSSYRFTKNLTAAYSAVSVNLMMYVLLMLTSIYHCAPMTERADHLQQQKTALLEFQSDTPKTVDQIDTIRSDHHKVKSFLNGNPAAERRNPGAKLHDQAHQLGHDRLSNKLMDLSTASAKSEQIPHFKQPLSDLNAEVNDDEGGEIILLILSSSSGEDIRTKDPKNPMIPSIR